MGIHNLMKLLNEECPEAIKEQEMKNLNGRKIAIDASMAMYQFLIAVRSTSDGGGYGQQQLTNDAGEVTSHIQGMFNRSIRMMTSGIKPCFVFDGKPPPMKGGELAKRSAKRTEAENGLEKATSDGNQEDIEKFQRRLVKVLPSHNADCKELLRLMGIPVVEAPCEAEAQCAELAKNGLVFATATEDMDALTFQTPKLMRRMTTAASQKQPILEIDYAKMLNGLDLTYDQFVDLCIMCGCDYCSTIKGIGPKTALKLIREHKSIEKILEKLLRDPKKNGDIPADWLNEPQKMMEKLEKQEEKIDETNENKMNDEKKKEEVVNEAQSMTENETESVKKDSEEKVPNTTVNVSETPMAVNSSTSISNDVMVTDTISNTPTTDSQMSQVPSQTTEKAEPEVPVSTATTTTTTTIPKIMKTEEREKFREEEKVWVPIYKQARQLFHNSEVTPASEFQLNWTAPDVDGLRKFLVERMGFQLERVNSGIEKLVKAHETKAQSRIDSFFTMKPSTNVNKIDKRKTDTKGKGKASFKKMKK